MDQHAKQACLNHLSRELNALSRRGFLKAAAVGLAVSTQPGCAVVAGDLVLEHPAHLQFLSFGQFKALLRLRDTLLPRDDGEFPGSTDVPVMENIDMLVGEMNAQVRADFGVAVRLFDFGALTTPPFLKRFTYMDDDQAQTYVKKWQNGVFVQRGIVASLKFLVHMAYWSDERTWSSIEYDGPVSDRWGIKHWVMHHCLPRKWIFSMSIEFREVQAEGLPVTRSQDVIDRRLRLRADVVIVGSGAGGSTMAYKLSKAGFKVIVLEAGRYLPSQQFNEKLGDSLLRLYQDQGMQPNALGDMRILQGACVGGSTVVGAAVCMRAPDHVLQDWQKQYGLDNLAPEVLASHYDQVEKELHISANQGHEINACAQKLIDGCSSLGISWQAARRNVRQCALTGHCLAGCRSDRKMSALVSYLPWAVAHGAEIYSDTRVVQIIEKHHRASGVRAWMIDPRTQRKVCDVQVDAQMVVMASGAIQTPYLLLGQGLANSSNWVGKNLSVHPSMAVLGQYAEPVYAWQGAHAGALVDEYLSPERGGFLFQSGLGAPEQLIVNGQSATGPAHFRFMKNYKHYAAINAFVPDKGTGYVRNEAATAFDSSKKIEWEKSWSDLKEFKKAVKIAGRIHFAAGADKVHLPSFEHLVAKNEKELDRKVDSIGFGLRGMFTFHCNAQHPQGTARMGGDPRESVVNQYCESHDVKGLFIVDASVLPSQLMVSPQETIHALGDYVSQHVVLRRSDYFIS